MAASLSRPTSTWTLSSTHSLTAITVKAFALCKGSKPCLVLYCTVDNTWPYLAPKGPKGYLHMAGEMTNARQRACGREEHGGGGRGSLTARSPSSPLVPSPLRARGAPERQEIGSTLEQERVVLKSAADQRARQLPQTDGGGTTPLQVSERQARWLGIPAGTRLQFRRRGNDSTRVCAAAAPVERTLHARVAPKRQQSTSTRWSSGMRARSHVDRCW